MLMARVGFRREFKKLKRREGFHDRKILNFRVSFASSEDLKN
jgi:hypothetical protein